MNKSLQLLIYAITCGTLLAVANAAAEPDPTNPTIPSFYQEAGLVRSHGAVSTHGNEHIDTFTGKLQWHNTDLVIPGAGGFNLVVKRSYSSPDLDYPEASPVGYGWTMHYGRVTRNAIVNICATDTAFYRASANPVLELPDGSRQVLYIALDGMSFITPSFWRAVCSLSGAGGLTVYSPDGTRYDMTTPGAQIGSPTHPVSTYYTSKITDRNGNTMSLGYQYVGIAFGVASVSASDGRQLTFSYAGSGLSSITDGSRTWNYTNSAGFLTEVTRPGGSTWKYAYNPIAPANVGQAAMNKVTYPTGGTIAYTYKSQYFHPNLPMSSVVASKTTSDNGSWSYAYKPATDPLPADITLWTSFPENKVDVTTVTGPDGTRKYAHIGYTSAPSGGVFQIGQLAWDNIDGVQATSYGSNMQLISLQPNQRPGDTLTFDQYTYAPIHWGHTTNHYGQLYSEDLNDIDAYGNPGSITESGTDQRTATVSYHIDTNRWILHRKKDETWVYKGAAGNATKNETVNVIARTFDGAGNLLAESNDGVTTGYTYYASGDMRTRTDAGNGLTTFTDYFRGVPRVEVQPEGVSIARLVDDAGNVTSVTDGELATTTYRYDGLNRVTSIGHPLGNPVAVARTANKRTVTRGSFKEDATYDGFERETELLHTDTSSGETTRVTSQYDAAGNRTYTSYPNNTVGNFYWYDALGQVLQVAHAYNKTTGLAASWRIFERANNTLKITNERNLATTYTYRAFSNPGELDVMKIAAPEASASVTISRDGAGQVTTVTQGGKTRTFGYDTRHFLTTKTEPETGTTTFGRDPLGNMTSSQVGAAGVTGYVYDGRNRLITTNYPDNSVATRTYYKDDKLKTMANGSASHLYTYDANKNLLQNKMTIGQQDFAVNYVYNGNDALGSVVYGSGKTVNYAPNAYGRATQAAPYVTAASYHPTGELKSMTYANGIQTNTTLNARLWPQSLKVGNGSLLVDKNYNYDQTGNVTRITDAALGTQREMGYDGIDRLTSVNGLASGPYSAVYDGRGNITSQTWGGATPSRALNYTYDASSELLTMLTETKGGATAKFAYGYDAHGNVTAKGVTKFAYPNGVTMKCSNCGLPNETAYDYDAADLRVRMQQDGTATYFVYGLGGRLLWEQVAGGLLTEYVYLAGKQVATRQQIPVTP